MKFGDLTWAEIEQQTNKIVVQPLGSLEQHGQHLPLLTDSMICEEIVRRLDAEIGEQILVMPLFWVGVSQHHRAFPGTMSVSAEIYIKLLEDMLECLVQYGFRRIFLLNAHIGNEISARQAILNVQLKHPDLNDLWLIFGNWMDLARQQIVSLADLAQKHVTHACELETSMILALRPELVQMDKAIGATIPFESNFLSPDFSRASRVVSPHSFRQLSRSGAFGHPELATAQKGRDLFDVAVKEALDFLKEFALWPDIQAG